MTNEIKAFKFSNGEPVPGEWAKGRLVSYKMYKNFSTNIGDSFAGLSKRPAYLHDIDRYLEEGPQEEKAVIMTYLFSEQYGWAQLRCGISIRFNFEHLCPDLVMIFSDRRRRYEQPRVTMQYEVWRDDRDKIRSLASYILYEGNDERGRGPFDPNNGLEPEWDWYER